MAKLFSKLAENKKGLEQVYNDSTVDSIQFNAVREKASSNPLDNIVANTDIKRIQPVYDMYTDRPSTTGLWGEGFRGNNIRLIPTVTRKRQSGFYTDFASVSSLFVVKGRANNDTYVEFKPYGKGIADESLMAQNSVSLPIVSGPRDEKRITGFLTSHPGILFLARQQILQAGNTFKQSRRYNPASPVLQAAKYTLSSLTSPLTRVDRALSIDNINAGRVQQETVIDKQSRLRLKYVGGSEGGGNRNTLIGQVINTGVSRFIQNTLNRTNIKIGKNKINVGQLGRSLANLSQTVSALGRATNISDSSLTKDQTPYDALYKEGLWPLLKKPDGTIQKFDTVQNDYVSRARASLNTIKGYLHTNKFTSAYPDTDPSRGGPYRSADSYSDDVKTSVGSTNGVTSARYMKDPMNLTEDGKRLTSIKDINGSYLDVDFIKFKIVVPTVFDGGISFRAFVKDIKHNSKGDFEEQRYVGRPERFIVYKGMNRSLTFELYLAAFSEAELSGMWARANMLNKLVYPINAVGGYMVPPLINMTLGNIIEDQPGYITDISMDLSESPWDISAELTQVIKMNITYNIIEKNYITQAQTGLYSHIFASGYLFDPFSDNINLSQINVNVPDLTPQLPDMSSQFEPQNIGQEILNVQTQTGHAPDTRLLQSIIQSGLA